MINPPTGLSALIVQAIARLALPPLSVLVPWTICIARTCVPVMTTDPSVLRSLAVSAEDLLAAMEADAREGPRTVLRVTPPFSGRMRARLHVVQAADDDGTVHIPPRALLDDGAPTYPTPDETADELRSHEDLDYSVDRHREYHEERVDAWRSALLDHVVDSVTIDDVDGEIGVSLLGP